VDLRTEEIMGGVQTIRRHLIEIERHREIQDGMLDNLNRKHQYSDIVIELNINHTDRFKLVKCRYFSNGFYVKTDVMDEKIEELSRQIINLQSENQRLIEENNLLKVSGSGKKSFCTQLSSFFKKK
jgi:endonuclease III-like uncharacterized protein